MLIDQILGAVLNEGRPPGWFPKQNPNQYRNNNPNDANRSHGNVPRGVGLAERRGDLATNGLAHINSNVETADEQSVNVRLSLPTPHCSCG